MENSELSKENNEEISNDTDGEVSEDEFIEEGNMDVKPYLDASDGGTLDQDSSSQTSTIILGFVVLIIVLLFLLSKLSPIIRPIFFKKKPAKIDEVAQNNNPDENKGTEIDSI